MINLIIIDLLRIMLVSWFSNHGLLIIIVDFDINEGHDVLLSLGMILGRYLIRGWVMSNIFRSENCRNIICGCYNSFIEIEMWVGDVSFLQGESKVLGSLW